MRVETASSPGHDRPNEDFVGAAPGAVVLLDGAGIPGGDELCHHGTAWYSHTLGSRVLERLSREPGMDLAAALAGAIEQVAGLHRHTCDIASPISPQATVAIVRYDGDRADYLVLADVFVVLDVAEAGPLVVTDPREVDVRDECASVLRDLTAGTPEHEWAELSARDAFRARRNQAGGYWIAKDDPRAAMEAVAGSVPLEGLKGAALLSNGASRVVEPYRLMEWPSVLDVLRTNGPDEILRRVRAAEAEADDPDDATVAYCEPA